MELPAAAARRSGWPRRAARRSPRPTCSARSTCCRRPLLRRDRAPGPAPGGAADRRGRPGRRRVRGVPVRAAGRGRGHHPGAGHPARRRPADRRAHLQPHPRPARRAQAALPLPLDRLPRRRTGSPRSSAGGCPARPSRWPTRSPRRCERLRALDLYKPPGVAEAIDWASALQVLGLSDARTRRRAGEHTLGAVLKYDEDLAKARERPGCSTLAAGVPRWPTSRVLAARFGAAAAGRGPAGRAGPVGAVRLAPSRSRGRRRSAELYWCGAGDAGRRPGRDPVFDRVFDAGLRRAGRRRPSRGDPNAPPCRAGAEPAAAGRRPRRRGRRRRRVAGAETGRPPPTRRRTATSSRRTRPWPRPPSGWAARDFASLSARRAGPARRGRCGGCALATPPRRSRRVRAAGRAGGGSTCAPRCARRQRSGGYPVRLARHRLRMRPRRLVVLCDISGSMEPYARALLQLVYCAAAAGGPRAEVFTFATRLTRLTRVLARVPPEVALERAGRAAPDWSGGTRIGEALKAFLDRYGARGLARGAVVLIISDGWETGDAGACWASRWPACRGWRTGSCGPTRAPRRPATSRWSRGMAAALAVLRRRRQRPLAVRCGRTDRGAAAA